VILTFAPIYPYISVISSTLMAGKYRNESKHRINGRENTGTKVNIRLMVGKYRNESITLMFPTISVILTFVPVFLYH
jgi:hypothetical protein